MVTDWSPCCCSNVQKKSHYTVLLQLKVRSERRRAAKDATAREMGVAGPDQKVVKF